MSPLESSGSCPHCGYSKKQEINTEYLRAGTTLANARYLVGRLARKNGATAFYVGYDNASGSTCWICEYFPTRLASRNKKSGYVAPTEGNSAQYKALLSDFMDICNEIKRLGITEKVIPILATFGENNTIYAVYEHLNVVNLERYIVQNGGKLPLNKTLDMMLPFCNMVATIHDRGYIHRGISPHTVYVGDDDSLYLWDFSIGALRTANSELDAELFNGYSAPEQYAANGWQGTWSDVYAVGALFYRMLSGFVPPKSTTVGEERHLSPLIDLVVDLPQNVSDAVFDAMIISTEKRTPAIYNFTSKLMENDGTGTAIYDTVKPIKSRREEAIEERREKDGGFKYAILALFVTVLVLVGSLWFVMNKYFPHMMNNEDKKPETHSLSESSADFEESSSEFADANVPKFIGKLLTQVQSDVEYGEHYTFTVVEEYNSEFSAGVIFSQSPDEGTPMPNRGTIILHVSKGSEADLVAMPNIIGLDFNEAAQILAQKEILLEKVERTAEGAVAGSVVGTVPAPGNKLNSKTEKATIYVMPGITPVTPESSVAEESQSQKPQESSKESSSKTSSSSKSSSSSSSKKPSSSKESSSKK